MKNIEPELYVGTYAKYNSGNLHGAWIALTDFDSVDDFYEECRKLHSDESDPEFMFQDYSNIPHSLYSESSIPDELWEFVEVVSDGQDIDMLMAAAECGFNANEAVDRFYGKYDSDSDFAQDYADSTGAFNDTREITWPYNHIDWEAAARDLMVDFTSHDGFYFHLG